MLATEPPELSNKSKPRDRRSFRYFDVLLSVFIVILLMSNLVGQKICAIGPFRISAAQLLFPITYIFGDIFTEVYGMGHRAGPSGLAFSHRR